MNSKLGEIIKKARHEKGWSQTQLAEEVKRNFPPHGVSQSTINRIENPIYQANPTEETKQKLLLTLGIISDKQIVGETIKTFDPDLQKEAKLLKEQVDFYKEKADFYEERCINLEKRCSELEKKCVELECMLLSDKRSGDPEDVDVIKLRKVAEKSQFPYGFEQME